MSTWAILKRAMGRALQWRLLLLSPIVLLIGAAATLFPLARFFGDLFDRSPRWKEITASLDSSALVGVAKALSTPASSGIATGVQTSLFLGVFLSPFLAGAALTVAEKDERLKLRGLLSGAGGYYPRLLRMQFVAAIPLGIAGAIAGAAFGWASGVAEKATTEGATHTSGRIALLLTVVAVFLGQLVVDAARARFVAEPARRSALYALGAGVKLVVKRPLRVLSIGFLPAVIALAAAAVVVVIRQQITQSSGISVILAFLFAQLAVASMAWGHAAKLCGLVEIARDLVATTAARPKPVTPAPVQPAPVTPPADVPSPEVPTLPASPGEQVAPVAQPES